MTGYNWEKIIKDFNANSSILDSIKDKADEFIKSYEDHAEWKAGWGHDFVCDYCSGTLIFDPLKEGYTHVVYVKKRIKEIIRTGRGHPHTEAQVAHMLNTQVCFITLPNRKCI